MNKCLLFDSLHTPKMVSFVTYACSHSPNCFYTGNYDRASPHGHSSMAQQIDFDA